MEEAAKSKLISHYISTLSIGHNYICTHCLIHMGDIARYKGQVKQAESFYKHSLTVSPASGHSYNQLALVEVSKGSNFVRKTMSNVYKVTEIEGKGLGCVATTDIEKGSLTLTENPQICGNTEEKVGSSKWIKPMSQFIAYSTTQASPQS